MIYAIAGFSLGVFLGMVGGGYVIWGRLVPALRSCRTYAAMIADEHPDQRMRDVAREAVDKADLALVGPRGDR